MAGYVKELARTNVSGTSGPAIVELSWALPGGCTSLWIEANWGIVGSGTSAMRMKWNGAWAAGSNAAAKDSYLLSQIKEYSHDYFQGQHNNLDTGNNNRMTYGFEIECPPPGYRWYANNHELPENGLLGYVLSPATTDNMKMPVFQYWCTASSNNSSADASYSWSQRWGNGIIDPYAHDAVTKAAFTSMRFECAGPSDYFSDMSTFAVHAYGA
tara:strand:- start:1113 stop:1751 length:639 start_codon:yes stop_codon:yes gene_type:complete